MMMSRQVAFILLVMLFVVDAGAAETEQPRDSSNLSEELPRIAPVEPGDALKTFELQPGFTIEQIAAEPLLNSPVAFCYDADSKLYVAEMRDYSEQEHDRLGQIRLLEDTNGDGIYDKSSLFATGLSWPTAILCYDGGVFVGAAPEILYLKDTDGDGRADEKRTVFTGFGRSNVQGLLNSFRWGLDGRIHGATSVCGGDVKRPDDSESPALVLRGRDFSFDPETLDLRSESGGGQHGICFDDWGRKFTCANSLLAAFIQFEERYVVRNPLMTSPRPLVSISDDGNTPPVFRSSPAEPWRIVRTRMRREGEFRGPVIEGNGMAVGYFIAATGITLFGGDALGHELRGMAIIGDVGSNLVHRRKLIPHGIKFRATRVDQESEFVRSSDIWFRPVQFANAPDGSLHLLDMYREVIEHPRSFPDVVKAHLDLTSGRDRGRLYRVYRTGETLRSPPRLKNLSSLELVSFLSHDNVWHRETANRLLFERKDKSVVPALRQLVQTGDKPLGRLHALAVLRGMNELDEESVVNGLRDSQPEIREAALRHAELFPDSHAVRTAASHLVHDDAIRVRYQLAFSAGEFPLETRLPWLRELVLQDGTDPLVCLAIQSSLKEGADPLLAALLATLLKGDSPHPAVLRSPLLPNLTSQVARQAGGQQVDPLLDLVLSLPDQQKSLKTTLLITLMSNNSRIRQRLSEGQDAHVLKALFESARGESGESSPVQKRLAAIAILPLSRDPEDLARLLELLAPHESAEIQLAALASLATISSPEIATGVLSRWQEMTPGIRASAEEMLFSRNEWISIVLDQMESGQLPQRAIPSSRLTAVMAGSSQELQRRAKRLQDSSGTTSRTQALKDFASAITLSGNVEQGKQLFVKHCSACHRMEGIGYEIGPNLSTIKNRGVETIFVNVLDPNREINPEFLNYVVSLVDGRTRTGMIRGESATSLTLLRAENQSDSLLRTEIEQIRNTGMSLMPEELEKQFSPQGLADLLAYLMAVE